ncbi:unnamed protein product [Citrullus colocynthis]|uniref:MSP domain-containing protein n=1 Tax=Citrullus colocynthis TaxID=252529 RepID=A0ABP0Z6I1_9ROSI
MGIIEPLSTCEVRFTMKAQSIPPSDMICKDKFLIQSTIVPIETTVEDITSNNGLFGKNSSKNIEERKLATILVVRPSNSPTIEALSVGVSDQSNDKQIEELKLKNNELDLQLHQARVAISKLEKERTRTKKTKSLQKNCTIL